MIYVQADNILKAVKKVYLQLFPTGLKPSDQELQGEDSATILVESNRRKVKEAVSLSGDELLYSYKYEKFFPYAKDTKEILTLKEDIVSFEMRFWNDDLMGPKPHAPRGRLRQVADLLSSKPDRGRRAVVSLWDETIHQTSPYAPCLTHIVFRRKDDALEMHSHLRANDICFLLFMDMQVMSGVHKIVADWLQLKKGTYVHFVDSLHFQKKYNDLVKRQYEYILRSRAWKNI